MKCPFSGTWKHKELPNWSWEIEDPKNSGKQRLANKVEETMESDLTHGNSELVPPAKRPLGLAIDFHHSVKSRLACLI